MPPYLLSATKRVLLLLVQGRVLATFVRGRQVFAASTPSAAARHGDRPCGALVLRG